jgi:PAS domain S-box-containing protein
MSNEYTRISTDEKVKKFFKINFETGTLSFEEIESIFNNLHVDVTFLDRNDIVRYYSQSKEMIFARTKDVIGRKVQQCHPKKVITIVDQILEDFKRGSRDVAEFWYNQDDKLIYIRYFPIRNNKREYLGTLEVTQDITDIQKIKGEKTLI